MTLAKATVLLLVTALLAACAQGGYSPDAVAATDQAMVPSGSGGMNDSTGTAIP